MTLSYQQEQRIRRVAFRLAQDSDEVFDEAVERITELVLDAIDIEHKRRYNERLKRQRHQLQT